MVAQTDSAVRHCGKVLLLCTVIGVVYTLGLAAVCRARPESMWAELGPRADSLRACLLEGWKQVLDQPLFWLTTGIVAALYDAVSGEIEPNP